MKTTIEFAQQTTEPAAPTPTTPLLTEEIIIPSVNHSEVSTEPIEIYTHKDEAYPLTHRMIYDLFSFQAKVIANHKFDDFEKAVLLQHHVEEHVQSQIYQGYLVETPLRLSNNPAEDAFTRFAASQYVKTEIDKMRQYGPDPEVIRPAYVEQSLFDSIEEVEAYEAVTSHTTPVMDSQPAHITEVSPDELDTNDIIVFDKFADIVRRAGGKALHVLGISFHSGEIPTVGPHGTKVIDVIPEKASV